MSLLTISQYSKGCQFCFSREVLQFGNNLLIDKIDLLMYTGWTCTAFEFRSPLIGNQLRQIWLSSYCCSSSPATSWLFVNQSYSTQVLTTKMLMDFGKRTYESMFHPSQSLYRCGLPRNIYLIRQHKAIERFENISNSQSNQTISCFEFIILNCMLYCRKMLFTRSNRIL